MQSLHHLIFLISAPIWGMLCKKNNLMAGHISGFIAGISYVVLFYSGKNIIFLNILLCLGAFGGMGVVISSSSLLCNVIGENSKGIGSAIFSISGSFGILFLSQLGGLLIDKYYVRAPFLLAGLCNILASLLFIFPLKGSLNQNK